MTATLRMEDPTVSEAFFEPLATALADYSRLAQDCPKLTDADFLAAGVHRVLAPVQSGRDFLQAFSELHGRSIARSSFFDGLHSARRLAVLTEVGAAVHRLGQRELAARDHLAAFAALRGRAVLAVDGHQIEHAAHALRDGKGRRVAAGSVYALCLHTGLMRSLAPFQGDGRHGHEIPAFRQVVHTMPEPTKAGLPIIIGDPAYIDLQLWTRLKRSRRAVVITRLKAGMKPLHYLREPFDTAAEINTGVEADQPVGFDNASTMRLICYRDPESGEYFEFLTNDFTLEPGLVAFLYLLRWRIEKLYDTTKNKLHETKAWANGRIAQQQQSHFVALAHNLLVLFLERLRRHHGLREEKLLAKREQHLAARAVRARQRGGRLSPLLCWLSDAAQLSAQFIRCLRNLLLINPPLRESVPRFRAMLTAYL